jgi:hypothetical protein
MLLIHKVRVYKALERHISPPRRCERSAAILRQAGTARRAAINASLGAAVACNKSFSIPFLEVVALGMGVKVGRGLNTQQLAKRIHPRRDAVLCVFPIQIGNAYLTLQIQRCKILRLYSNPLPSAPGFRPTSNFAEMQARLHWRCSVFYVQRHHKPGMLVVVRDCVCYFCFINLFYKPETIERRRKGKRIFE